MTMVHVQDELFQQPEYVEAVEGRNRRVPEFHSDMVELRHPASYAMRFDLVLPSQGISNTPVFSRAQALQNRYFHCTLTPPFHRCRQKDRPSPQCDNLFVWPQWTGGAIWIRKLLIIFRSSPVMP